MPHILITGASSGLGAALALEYTAPGTRLSLHGRSAEKLARVAAEAEKRGATVTVTPGDVTDAAAMADWVKAMDALQPLDLVIANAGISGGTFGGDAGQTSAIFAVNLTGALNTVTPAVLPMLARGQGQIALISSIASFRGFAGASAYCASKAALRVYGESLRADLAPQGVKVNVICPGFIKTPMTDVNPFPMPFLMTAARAARIIRKGLASDRARIAFPALMHWGINLIALLPQDLVNRLSPRIGRKPPFDAPQ